MHLPSYRLELVLILFPTDGQGPAGGSLDYDEIAKVGVTSSGWWDVDGNFCLLHHMKPVRAMPICQHWFLHIRSMAVSKWLSMKPFASPSFLDVGSGGGLLSEPLV